MFHSQHSKHVSQPAREYVVIGLTHRRIMCNYPIPKSFVNLTLLPHNQSSHQPYTIKKQWMWGLERLYGLFSPLKVLFSLSGWPQLKVLALGSLPLVMPVVRKSQKVRMDLGLGFCAEKAFSGHVMVNSHPVCSRQCPIANTVMVRFCI